MRTNLVLAATAGALLLSGPAAWAGATQEAPVGPLLPIADSKGAWQIIGPSGDTFQRRITLRYVASVHPQLRLAMMELRCRFPHWLAVEVTGMVPVQAFPQPPLTIAIAGLKLESFANASYYAPSPATVTPTPPGAKFEGALARLNETKVISWPGHPAYAKLSMTKPAPSSFIDALLSGQPVEARFENQVRHYPGVPPELARKFADVCMGLPTRPQSPLPHKGPNVRTG